MTPADLFNRPEIDAESEAAAADHARFSPSETADYFADLEWVECAPCKGTGCDLCSNEGGSMEVVNGLV